MEFFTFSTTTNLNWPYLLNEKRFCIDFLGETKVKHILKDGLIGIKIHRYRSHTVRDMTNNRFTILAS